MVKNWEINGTEEIGFVTPTPEDDPAVVGTYLLMPNL